jgi:hypothetical protein
MVSLAFAALTFGFPSSTKGCLVALASTTTSHMIRYTDIKNDGNVVHSSPYFQMFEIEKKETEEADIWGTAAMPFLVEDIRSKTMMRTISDISMNIITDIIHRLSSHDR